MRYLNQWLALLSGFFLCMTAIYIWNFSVFWQAALLYLGCSFITFILFWFDKNRSRQKGWRIPERRLQLLSIVGGWPGAFLAIVLLKHKSNKVSFCLLLYGVSLFNIIINTLYLSGYYLHFI
jgi:uncharacterized membrane protein YsdA (DUF1294 family)